ncbi:MAG: PDZ domain-containing protein, partial [Planctomycetia bacterium]
MRVQNPVQTALSFCVAAAAMTSTPVVVHAGDDADRSARTVPFLIETRPLGFLGILGTDAKSADGDDTVTKQGAAVTVVLPGSPAEQAGLKTGDVIVELNDKKIAVFSALGQALAKAKPGEKVELTIVRDGKEKEL